MDRTCISPLYHPAFFSSTGESKGNDSELGKLIGLADRCAPSTRLRQRQIEILVKIPKRHPNALRQFKRDQRRFAGQHVDPEYAQYRRPTVYMNERLILPEAARAAAPCCPNPAVLGPLRGLGFEKFDKPRQTLLKHVGNPAKRNSPVRAGLPLDVSWTLPLGGVRPRAQRREQRKQTGERTLPQPSLPIGLVRLWYRMSIEYDSILREPDDNVVRVRA